MTPATASVLLRYLGSNPPLREEEVKRLVAHGIEGLHPDNVAVIFNRVQPRQVPDRNLIPVLGNQEVLIASLGLLGLTSIGCLGLVTRARLQRSSIEKLRRELRTASQRSQLTETGTAK
jgi:type III secretory pathway lipoprotein EscJ